MPPRRWRRRSASPAELGWNGQISFDFLTTADGVHHMVECNPRPTAGCTLATAEELDAALFGPVPDEPVVVPAGRKTADQGRRAAGHGAAPASGPADARATKGAAGVYEQAHDHLPMLYTVLSLQHVRHYRKALGLDKRDTRGPGRRPVLRRPLGRNADPRMRATTWP